MELLGVRGLAMMPGSVAPRRRGSAATGGAMDAPGPSPSVHGTWNLRSSRFLLPGQQLLQQFFNLPVDNTQRSTNAKAATTALQAQQDVGAAPGGRGDGVGRRRQ
uniref:Uncharacterized protein n=1 Tax=Oryza brachyantha TaxID=4533 RepID=J3LUV2_ORYBR